MDKRSERYNAIRTQFGHKCTFENCDKQFKKLTELKRHSLIAHCLTVKKPTIPIQFKQVQKFTLKTTQLTKAARINYQFKHGNYFQKLARNPCKIECDFESIRKECKKLLLFIS